MNIVPATATAIELFHTGTVALAEVEATGMRVDTAYLQQATTEVGQEIAELEAQLRAMPEYALQRRLYGDATKLAGREQLAAVYHAQGYEFTRWTGGGKTGKRRPKMDDATLDAIGTPYAQLFRRCERLRKLHGTYLLGIGREVCGDTVHMCFNLNPVVSYRSSCSDPNLQNVPVREPEIARIIRRAFIPRPGHVLVDCDYTGQEVRVACSVSGDPKLTEDTLQGDMHRDMAAECYMVPVPEVSKPMRQATKGGFVFAEFYGDYYRQVCQNLWGAASKGDLRLASGVPVLEHLAQQGIRELGACRPKGDPVPGTYEHHIQQVENRFWNERFRVYHEYRRRLVRDYRACGYFQMVTGFVCQGVFTKNQVINYPVQGPAFHCLLWSLVQLNAALRRLRMRSRVVGQIHDSIIGDVYRPELPAYVELVREITTQRIMRAPGWGWLTVPLGIEVEVAEESWADKQAYTLAA